MSHSFFEHENAFLLIEACFIFYFCSNNNQAFHFCFNINFSFKFFRLDHIILGIEYTQLIHEDIDK